MFIIIAIIIVAAGLATWLVYRNYQRTRELLATEIASVKNYLQETITYEVSSSLILIGLQGGYSDYPKKFLQLQYHFIPYYYSNKKEAKVYTIPRKNSELGRSDECLR